MDKPNYVVEAFKRQENIIVLAGFVVAAAMFKNTGFLYLAGGLEVAYLWALATNPRFHRVVHAEKNKAVALITQNQRDAMVAALPKAERDRFLDLASIRLRVFELWRSRDSVTQSLLQPGVEKMDYLLDTFLRTQTAVVQMREHLSDADRPFVERQAEALAAELKRGVSDKLREPKEKNLELLRQRLARLNKLKEDHDLARTQLDTLENAVKFISDQSAALSDPRQITQEIDRAVEEMGDAERSIQEVESFLAADPLPAADRKRDAASAAKRERQ